LRLVVVVYQRGIQQRQILLRSSRILRCLARGGRPCIVEAIREPVRDDSEPGHRSYFSTEASSCMRQFRSRGYQPGMASVKQCRIELHQISSKVLLVISIGFGFRIEEFAVQV